MPPASSTLHRTFTNPVLPFVTNSSPLSNDPQYIGGRNILGSVQSKLERRPGFSGVVESSSAQAATFTGTISKIFTWQKWSGAFISMVCETTSTTSKVYAYRSGTDINFQQIYSATATDGQAFSFCVANNTCFMGNGNANDMRAYDGSSLTTRKWGISAPSAAPSVTTGTSGSTMNVYRSFYYVYTYCNSSTAHESSPSSLSACISPSTGINGLITVTASSDSQVDQIRVYRTTDGGSSDPPDMREITGSPFTNTSQTITDATADTSLGSRTAPEFSRNDPPPGMKGIKYFEQSSRIGGFANDTLYYSGFEEIGNGVPYECFPGGLDGNNYPFGKPLTGLAEIDGGIAIFTADSIQGVMGDSLDTFRRVTIAKRQGAKNYNCIADLGSMCVWLDTSGTVWMLGGEEIGEDIRPSLSGIDHTQAQIAIHIYGTRRWICLLDGANSLLYTYDLDLGHWNVPWAIAATSIHSGEVSSGVYSLMCGLSTSHKVQTMVEGSFNDGGTPYSMSLQTGMFDIAPPAKPDYRAAVWFIDVKRNQVASPSSALSGMSILTDDDPTLATYTDMSANKENQPLVPQGTYIYAERWTVAPAQPVGRMASVQMTWPANDVKTELYYWDVGFTPVGG